MANINEENIREYWDAIREVYEEQKKDESLYRNDGANATGIIQLFYNLAPDAYFNLGMQRFKRKYINNETNFEQNEYTKNHTKEERDGLAEMYKFIETFDFEKNGRNFSIYILMKLHQLLFSKSAHPEAGGAFRNQPAYISENAVDIYPWEFVQREINDRAQEYNRIADLDIRTSSDIISYIDECTIFTTNLLRVHPFVDGNGRSIRGLQNLMFKKANIPPVYVEPHEKEAYLAAIHKAQALGDYSDIKVFYYYKVCDSLFELTDSKVKQSTATVDSNRGTIKK